MVSSSVNATRNTSPPRTWSQIAAMAPTQSSQTSPQSTAPKATINLAKIVYSCGHSTRINEDDRREQWCDMPNSSSNTAKRTAIFASRYVAKPYRESFPCPSLQCRKLLKARRAAEYELLGMERGCDARPVDEDVEDAREEHFHACIRSQAYLHEYTARWPSKPTWLDPMGLGEGGIVVIEGQRRFDVTYGMLRGVGVQQRSELEELAESMDRDVSQASQVLSLTENRKASPPGWYGLSASPPLPPAEFTDADQPMHSQALERKQSSNSLRAVPPRIIVTEASSVLPEHSSPNTSDTGYGEGEDGGVQLRRNSMQGAIALWKEKVAMLGKDSAPQCEDGHFRRQLEISRW